MIIILPIGGIGQRFKKNGYEELGKRCVVKTEGQEVFKKYTGIFAISSKGIIRYDVYKKGGIGSNRMVILLTSL